MDWSHALNTAQIRWLTQSPIGFEFDSKVNGQKSVSSASVANCCAQTHIFQAHFRSVAVTRLPKIIVWIIEIMICLRREQSIFDKKSHTKIWFQPSVMRRACMQFNFGILRAHGDTFILFSFQFRISGEIRLGLNLKQTKQTNNSETEKNNFLRSCHQMVFAATHSHQYARGKMVCSNQRRQSKWRWTIEWRMIIIIITITAASRICVAENSNR